VKRGLKADPGAYSARYQEVEGGEREIGEIEREQWTGGAVAWTHGLYASRGEHGVERGEDLSRGILHRDPAEGKHHEQILMSLGFG
jgi:hypothetical protein